MVLPDCVLFPHALLPLHMFEERYRRMVAHCLERDRMFCIALPRPGHTEAENLDRWFPVAGLGLIRACVGNPDGTSNLVLQGVIRVELTRLVSISPFPLAEIRPLPSEMTAAVEADALSVKVIELCTSLKTNGREIPAGLAKKLPDLNDPDSLADIVAHAFIEDPYERQTLLGLRSVSERLRLLITLLRRAGAQDAPGESA
jgi:Lon protease-like protein